MAERKWVMKIDVLNLLDIDENHKIECKLAEGGLPESIWETYSAFANTDGGSILLGIKEHRDSFEVKGLDDKKLVKYQKDFWSTINNRDKISNNILLNHHVQIKEVDGKKILKIDVPAADRHDKPVYIGPNPITGTFRRNFDGDFRCAEEDVRGMFADQQDVSRDSQVMEELGMDAFNLDTIKGYRIRFESVNEDHPWNKLPLEDFLVKLTAAKKNSKGELSPTMAGLLMFGDADQIAQVFPNYFLDYREESNEKDVRWLFRVTSDDGDWSGNLFDFFYKVVNRIDSDIAVPFGKRVNHARVSRTTVHEALHEVIANALIHANYYGRRGIVIVKNRGKISIANPGTLRISKEEFFAGGNSDPRNPIIFKMFGRVNVGEHAGSGVDKIFNAWDEQDWERPDFDISYSPERITVKLEVGQIKYIPNSVDLRDSVKTVIKDEMSNEEKILAYIKANGSISMGQVVTLCGYKSRTTPRKIITKMIEDGKIAVIGSGNNTKYVKIN